MELSIINPNYLWIVKKGIWLNEILPKLKKEEDSIPCLQALFTAQKTQARGLPYWQSIEELQTEK